MRGKTENKGTGTNGEEIKNSGKNAAGKTAAGKTAAERTAAGKNAAGEKTAERKDGRKNAAGRAERKRIGRREIGIVIMMAAILGVVTVSQMAGEHLLKRMNDQKSVQTAGTAQSAVIVVDSGHGGKDPGKIGINNSLEKEINLQIAEKVQKELKKQKVKVIMTRESDESLQDSKVEDLKARVELINQNKPLLAVSIHQNSYPEESIHGAQVFYYSHSKEGETAAKMIQETLRSVAPENHRQAKANDTYYMLKKTETPVVIVECGFLSNSQEAEQLGDAAYQEKLAKAITAGIMEYIAGKQ